jgi:hypothetical protein
MLVADGTLPWNNLALCIKSKGQVDESRSYSAHPYIKSQLNWLSGLKIFKVFVSFFTKTVLQINP